MLALLFYYVGILGGKKMKPGHRFRIVTNNPLVRDCLCDWYEIDYHEVSFREILVMVRDLVHLGHQLYTHPIAGSVKPNETPYKSIVVDKAPGKFSMDEANLMTNALITFDKFKPLNVRYSDYHHQDFQLIDYTLLCGALDVDAIAGLSKINYQKII